MKLRLIVISGLLILAAVLIIARRPAPTLKHKQVNPVAVMNGQYDA